MPRANPRGRAALLAVGAPAAALVASCASLAPDPDPRPVVRGPLPIRNQQPVAQTFLEPRPRRAATQPAGTWGAGARVEYSSTFEVAREPGDAAAFDGELLRAGARVRYGLDDRTDVEVEIAGLFGSSGFLDGFVDAFHSTFALADGGREDAPRDRFRMRLRKDGELAWSLEEDEPMMLDLPVVVTRRLRDEDEAGPALAWRVGVELPTGSESRGGTNEGVDVSIGALAEQSVGRWTWTAGADVVRVHEPSSYDVAGISLRPLVLLTSAVEYRWDDHSSLLAGLLFQSPITRDLAFEEIDREVLNLGVGFARDAGPGVLRVSFHEDLVAASGPDFAVAVGWSVGW